MGLFTLTVNAEINQPPSQIGNLTLSLDYNELYVFTLANFTTGTVPEYLDPEGDVVENVKVITLPTKGTLTLNGINVVLNQEISNANIVAGLLKYQADPVETAGYVDNTMTFDISDVGSSTYSGLTPGIVTITVGEDVNLPPSEVGDNSLTTDYGVTIVFTAANFTTGTTPPYADPESDAASMLRIDSLPTQGNLQLNGVNVVLNQEISFADISSGFFTYVPDNTDTSDYIVDFDFSIKDTGSGQYTS